MVIHRCSGKLRCSRKLLEKQGRRKNHREKLKEAKLLPQGHDLTGWCDSCWCELFWHCSRNAEKWCSRSDKWLRFSPLLISIKTQNQVEIVTNGWTAMLWEFSSGVNFVSQEGRKCWQIEWSATCNTCHPTDSIFWFEEHGSRWRWLMLFFFFVFFFLQEQTWGNRNLTVKLWKGADMCKKKKQHVKRKIFHQKVVSFRLCVQHWRSEEVYLSDEDCMRT